MAKVKAKLKTGGTIEIYEGEKYRLWKKGLIEVSKKEDEAYKDKQANEPIFKMKKAMEGSQSDRLNQRLEKLEKKGVSNDGGYDDTDLKEKISKLEDDLLAALERLDELEKPKTDKPAPSQNK